MWPAFPASDYYGLSVPCRRHQSATDLPTRPNRLPGTGGTYDRVPAFTVDRFDGIGIQLCPCTIAITTPQAFAMASRADDILRPGSSPLRAPSVLA